MLIDDVTVRNDDKCPCVRVFQEEKWEPEWLESSVSGLNYFSLLQGTAVSTF